MNSSRRCPENPFVCLRYPRLFFNGEKSNVLEKKYSFLKCEIPSGGQTSLETEGSLWGGRSDRDTGADNPKIQILFPAPHQSHPG